MLINWQALSFKNLELQTVIWYKADVRTKTMYKIWAETCVFVSLSWLYDVSKNLQMWTESLEYVQECADMFVTLSVDV